MIGIGYSSRRTHIPLTVRMRFLRSAISYAKRRFVMVKARLRVYRKCYNRNITISRRYQKIADKIRTDFRERHKRIAARKRRQKYRYAARTLKRSALRCRKKANFYFRKALILKRRIAKLNREVEAEAMRIKKRLARRLVRPVRKRPSPSRIYTRRYVSQLKSAFNRRYALLRRKYDVALRELRHLRRYMSSSAYAKKINAIRRMYTIQINRLKKQYKRLLMKQKIKKLKKKPSVAWKIKYFKLLKQLSNYKRRAKARAKLAKKMKIKKLRAAKAKLLRLKAKKRARSYYRLKRLYEIKKKRRMRRLRILRNLMRMKRDKQRAMLRRLIALQKMPYKERQKRIARRIAEIERKNKEKEKELIRKLKARHLLEMKKREAEFAKRMSKKQREAKLKELRKQREEYLKKIAVLKAKQARTQKAREEKLAKLKAYKEKLNAVKKAIRRLKLIKTKKDLVKEKIENIKKRAFAEGVREAKKLLPKKIREETKSEKETLRKQSEKMKKYEKVLKKNIQQVKQKEKEMKRKISELKTKLPSVKTAIETIRNEANNKLREARNATTAERARANYIVKLLSRRLEEEKARRSDMMHTAKLLESQIIQVTAYRDRLTDALNKVYNRVEQLKPVSTSKSSTPAVVKKITPAA